MESPKRIVVLGGGTGTFTLLSGLKHHPVDLAAVVSVADDGGSTGMLRDELGVLPPGDIRQCLVALSMGDDILRHLFMYRFHEGSLAGQNFGNLFLSALEKITGDPLTAICEAHRILNVKGRVIPVSPRASHLFAELEDGTVVEGQHAIDEPETIRASIRRCFLSPSALATPEACEAILAADAVVMGPGDLYTSLIPVLLVEGVHEALVKTSAKRIFIVNLMTKRGQTDGFTASAYHRIVSEAIYPAPLDVVLINSAPLPQDILKRYAQASEVAVPDDFLTTDSHIIRLPLLADQLVEIIPGDRIRRSLLRHDSDKLAKAILDCFLR